MTGLFRKKWKKTPINRQSRDIPIIINTLEELRLSLEHLDEPIKKKLKKEIQITTPGLKKSIKKFEDFTISISVEEVTPEEMTMDVINPGEEESCVDCEFDGGEETTQTTDVSGVVPFMDFIKNV